MATVLLTVFTLFGMAAAAWEFRRFPWDEKPGKVGYVITLAIYLMLGGGIGWLAGGWLAGRLP